MKDLIELTKRNEVLDALWYSQIFNKNIEDLPAKDIFGAAGEVLDIGQLIFGKYRLVLIYNKTVSGLYTRYSSDDELRDYIDNHLSTAFKEAIIPYKPYIYTINLASVTNYGAFSWEKSGDLLERQLSIFMPIIKEFMVRAVTDTIEK